MASVSLASSPNIAGLQALARTNSLLQDSVYRLASGNRFAPGSTDIGITLASRLQGQVSSLRQAQQNSVQAGSLVDVARGGLQEINELLIRQQGLAVAASSGALSDSDRALLDAEFQQLGEQIDSIAGTTSFGGRALLDGTFEGAGALTLQIGANADETLSIEIEEASTDQLYDGTAPRLDTIIEADAAQDTIADAIAAVQSALADLGAYGARLDTVGSNLGSQIGGVEAARSSIADTEVAEESSRYALLAVQQKTAIAVLAQSNKLNSNLLDLVQRSAD